MNHLQSLQFIYNKIRAAQRKKQMNRNRTTVVQNERQTEKKEVEHRVQICWCAWMQQCKIWFINKVVKAMYKNNKTKLE